MIGFLVLLSNTVVLWLTLVDQSQQEPVAGEEPPHLTRCSISSASAASTSPRRRFKLKAARLITKVFKIESKHCYSFIFYKRQSLENRVRSRLINEAFKLKAATDLLFFENYISKFGTGVVLSSEGQA